MTQTCGILIGMESSNDRDPWVGTADLARMLGCSQRLVQLSLADHARADETYGRGNWTDHARGPIAVKKVYGVRESVALRLMSRTL